MSGTELATKLLERIDLRKIAGIVVIVGCIVILAPKWILDRTGLASLTTPYFAWIALAVLFGLAFLLIEASAAFLRWRKRKRAEKARFKYFARLTNDEKAILLRFMSGENTLSFDISDGVAGGLVAKKILYVPTRMVNPVSVPHNLDDWAREHLEKNPSLLQN